MTDQEIATVKWEQYWEGFTNRSLYKTLKKLKDDLILDSYHRVAKAAYFSGFLTALKVVRYARAKAEKEEG